MHPAIESGRMAAYLYGFTRARDDGGRPVTSEALGKLAGVNATQVRRDLSEVFGKSGKRGVGYDASVMVRHIRRELAQTLRAPAGGGSAALVLITAEYRREGDHAPVDRIDGLVQEAALLVAEIDRLLEA